MKTIDYKLLLEKYIKHILSQEESDYITYTKINKDIFIDEEYAELKEICKNIEDKH